MECPKCGSNIKDSLTVCPICNKVIALKCPNCNSLGENPICQKCGFTILVKCAKCSKISPVKNNICSKCGFPLTTSLAYQECESDEFASINISFGALKNIKKILKSQELYSKFLFKLKNLLFAQIKNFDCKTIIYGDIFTVNLNKELSLSTSASKAIRLALKIINAYIDLNSKIMEELGINLNLTLTITQKNAENLQKMIDYKNNVKILSTPAKNKKYLKGLQIILDQYIWEEVQKDYKTDSLFSIEHNGQSIMFYEILLDSYVLPPNVENIEENTITVTPVQITQNNSQEDFSSENSFEINTKCSFYKADATNLFDTLDLINFNSGGKIISIKPEKFSNLQESSILEYFTNKNLNILRVNCSERLNYKPWGFFIELFKEYFNLPFHNNYIDLQKIGEKDIQKYKPIFNLILEKPLKALTPEDARYAYFEIWNKFLSTLKNTIIIINDFDYIDDTSMQVLEFYFDKFKNITPNFIFTNTKQESLHSKIKKLLHTECYSEILLKNTSIDSCLSTLKSDATDFIQSFYYEKIKENFKGSYLYFINALEFLKETGVLIDFGNKLLIKNNKSVILPTTLNSLLKARLKNISKNQDISLILAITAILRGRVDLNTLKKLEIENLDKNIDFILETGFVDLKNKILTFNNYGELLPIINSSIKKDAEIFLSKKILTCISKGLDDTSLAFCMETLSAFKEEYLTLWKNSQFAIKTGDYDAYLKNCIKFLSLLENVDLQIPKEDIDRNKKDVYNNILMFLYSYAPEKIYDIENILLIDAIEKEDNANIVKLSNLMLQGALISGNYTDALSLLHNILSRLQEPQLIVNGAINTKFLLLSLINVEILYNIGDFKQCCEIMENILSALQPEIMEKIKPASFSTDSFITHILESARIAAIAKLQLMDNKLDEFFNSVKTATGKDLPEKDCIIAIKDFLANKVYTTGNIEEYSAYSKIIFLILQEFNNLENDYKKFAKNVYQARLLALETHQHDIVFLCDLFIAYAYMQSNETKKAEKIFEDVLNTASKKAMFNVILVSKYLLAELRLKQDKKDDALIIINDCLKSAQDYGNQGKIFYTLFEKAYIDIVKDGTSIPCDIDSEMIKIEPYKESLKRLI